MPMLQEKRTLELDAASLESLSEQKQRRRMLAALGLLLVALVVVLVKDWDFWFPPESAGPELVESRSSAPGPNSATSSPERASKPASVAAHTSKSRVRSQPVQEAVVPAPATVTASRAVLPPLEIEVVAGGQHSTVPASNPSVKVDLQDGSLPFNQASERNTVENASERVTLSPGTAEVVSRPVEPNYPLLAKQMKVQGAVVLEAMISKTGSIQDLRVVSGPDILSDAARQAVKQWRFKPYYQNGQAVETEARITVNFTISTY